LIILIVSIYVAVAVDNHANDDELVSKRPGPVVNGPYPLLDHDDNNEFNNNLNNDQDDNHNSEDNVSTSSKHGGGSEKSEMWLYFTKVIWTKEKKTAQCKNCNHEPFSCGVN
ncbi:4655_t:CDS:2, partial [Dentiscutata erythropus]